MVLFLPAIFSVRKISRTFPRSRLSASPVATFRNGERPELRLSVTHGLFGMRKLQLDTEPWRQIYVSIVLPSIS